MLIIQLDGKAREFVSYCCNLATRFMTQDHDDGKICPEHYRKGMCDIIEIQRMMLINGPIVLRDALVLMLTSSMDLMLASTQNSFQSGAITADEAEMVVNLVQRVTNAYDSGEEIS